MSGNFCTKCGTSLKVNNVFCVKCGTKTGYESDLNVNKLKKKGRSKKKKLGIGFGITILLFFGLIILGSLSFDFNEKESKNSELSSSQIKINAIHGVNFDDLMRNNENYVGKILYLEGKIIQAQQSYGDVYDIRVSITKEELGFGSTIYSDPIYVNYEGDRILEEDIVGIYGQVTGIKNYNGVFGQTISVPEVNSLLLEVISKGT